MNNFTNMSRFPEEPTKVWYLTQGCIKNRTIPLTAFLRWIIFLVLIWDTQHFPVVVVSPAVLESEIGNHVQDSEKREAYTSWNQKRSLVHETINSEVKPLPADLNWSKKTVVPAGSHSIPTQLLSHQINCIKLYKNLTMF